MGTLLDAQRGGTPSGERVRRWVAALVIAVVVLAPVVYLGASWYVYRTPGEVSGECHPIDARNTPQLFGAPFLDPDALVAMPRPVDAPRCGDRGRGERGRVLDRPRRRPHGIRRCPA